MIRSGPITVKVFPMQKVIPPELKIDVSAQPLALSDTTLSRADGAVVLLEKTARPDKAVDTLPQAAVWRKLLQAHQRSGQESPILVTRLPNRSQTLVVVGFVKPGATGFERLELAGKLAHEVLKPGVARLHLHANEFTAPGERTAALEALLSAVLAHAAPMPEQKSKATVPCDLSHVDIADRASALYDRSRAIAVGQPPRALARDPAAQRARLDCLSRSTAAARAPRGLVVQVLRHRSARKNGRRCVPGRRPRQPAPWRGDRAPHLQAEAHTRRGATGIALVGKGICFDTGGINLKPHRGMYTMHGDMQGSAVAVGTLLALTRLEASYPIDCWLAITENQIGPNAFRPQEIVHALNGVTIQVVHSDAEGRMVLADTLTLASREKPRFVLDFATLTGACVNALTDRYAGAFTNRAGLHEWLQQAGRHSGERVWCFPMDEDFDAELECPGADVLQCTLESKGDHILASRFLSKFVEASVPWVHVDLAPSERKGGLAHVPTEMTGFGVRYAVHLLGDATELDAQLRSLP